MTWWPDDAGWPQGIGASAVLEGSRLTDPDGSLRQHAWSFRLIARTSPGWSALPTA